MSINTDDILSLIQRLRHGIIWKPSAAARHLLKRKLRGHLPTDATIADYEAVIQRVMSMVDASIYVYQTEGLHFLAVATWLEGRLWLVITSFEGIMETAFVVENTETYLEREAFQYVGKMSEVVR
jgi:hypothetical protein